MFGRATIRVVAHILVLLCFSLGNLIYVVYTINIRIDCCLAYLTVLLLLII